MPQRLGVLRALAVDDMPAVDFPASTHKHLEQHAQRQTFRRLRVVLSAPDGTPAAVGRGAGQLCALGCAGCVRGSVCVAALDGVTRARGKNEGWL